ncbi:MAG: hypothetical protein JXA06_01385 [Bacteroidetes bacterium]|nr:hypothetical protein [Bacteroidota bacterium]
MQMKQLYKYLFAAVIFVFVFSSLSSAQSNPVTISIEVYSSFIRIGWQVNSDPGIKYFEVWRKTGNSDAVYIGRAEQNERYYDDKNVGFHKKEDQIFYYTVKAVISPNLSLESNTIVAHYSNTSGSYKNTWGSIKAMFR